VRLAALSFPAARALLNIRRAAAAFKRRRRRRRDF
tara:strand:+ start:1674 stop:1778 length:105 start_codon:yes stop_codon:yes gene_type:complete